MSGLADWPLDPLETVLWQGRPNAWPFVTMSQVGRVIRVLIAGALLLYVLARLGYGLPPMTDIRVIVILIVFQAVPLEILGSSLSRRWTSYLLSNRRALIAVDWPVFGRRLRSVPILASTPVEMEEGRRYSSLFFAPLKRAFWDLRGGVPKLGFERIPDGRAVLALIGQMQKGAA